VAELVDEVTDLLQRLIRNACVNDGSNDSGHEHRSVATLHDYLGPTGCDLEIFEPHPGRQSILARLPGSDPDAPSLMYCGHLDVVPVERPDVWRHDPFGGELVDGVVWGRGAVDMLNLTASMAASFRHLATAGDFHPRGDLVYLGVADEEAGGTWGAEWLVRERPEAVRTDYVITELGGARVPFSPEAAPRLPVAVAEKGSFWCRITAEGTPGHGSMPLRTDNALVTIAEVIRRLERARFGPTFTEPWRGFVEGLAEDGGAEDEGDLSALLLDAERLPTALEELPQDQLARFVHACTHTTVAPTLCEVGTKINVIPDQATVQLDIRGLPGETRDSIHGRLEDALGDLQEQVEIAFDRADEPTQSPVETELWDVLQRQAERIVPGARNIPYLIPASTDARHLRRLGATCYGYGAYSDELGFDTFMGMFHGTDERIDQVSLRRVTELWLGVARDLLG
jgi:acetylornithine deacetylase/succinyl-diaminopimelate desuccinylase-like protein